MNVAAYIRVSTEEQVESGNSLTEQQERLEAYCKAMGWNKPIFFIDDGYSAKDLKRPHMQSLIKEIKQNKFEVVLTSKLDRLTRSLLDLLHVVKMFGEHNCNFVSASESFDTSTAAGRMVLQLLGVFAEFERERISERVKDNMLSLAKKTDKALTIPCYGYNVVNGKYVINNDEANYVRKMFDLAEQGHGHRMIAKTLNDLGSTTKRGKMWDQINIKRLMSNETLAGIMIYNKRQTKNGKTTFRDKKEWIIKENNHPAIIDVERFNQVRAILQSRSSAYKHADSETYLLTGLIKCIHCGRNMKGSTARHKSGNKSYTYFRYICSSYVLGYDCKHHAVHRDQLESFIFNQIDNLINSSDKEIKINISTPSDTKKEIKELKDQLAKVNRRMQKQIEAYGNDLITEADLKTATLNAEAERMRLNEELTRLENTNNDPSLVKEHAKALLDDITGTDRIAAKNALRQLIDYVDVQNGEVVDIYWKTPV